MPGWLSRAAACASRSTRRPSLGSPRLDRLDRDRALEAPVPGLVDDAEAAAADAALDQEAVEDQGADQSTSATSPRIRFLLRHTPCFLEDSSPRPGRSRGGHAVAPNASRSCCGAASRSGGGADAADPDRARGQGLPRRAGEPGAQRLRPQRHPDRRRDPPDEQGLLRQARRTRAASRSPSSSPRSTPTAARWTTTRPGSTASAPPATWATPRTRSNWSTSCAAARWTKSPNKMSTALGNVGAAEGDRRIIAWQMQKLLAERRRSTRRWCGRKSTACSPANGIEGSDVPKSVFLPDGTKWLDEATVSAALGSVSGSTAAATPGVHGLGLIGDQRQRHRTDRRNRPRRSPSEGTPEVEVKVAEPGRIDRERRHRLGHGERRQHPAGDDQQHRRRRNADRLRSR